MYRKAARIEWAESDAAFNAHAKGQPPAGPAAGAVTAVASFPCCNTVIDGCLANVGKRVFHVGGYDPHSASSLAQMMEYDVTSKMWVSHGHKSFPEQVSEAAMVAVGNVLFFFGGVARGCLSSSLWTATCGATPNLVMPGSTDGAGGAVGIDPAADAGASSRVSWRRMNPQNAREAPCARCGHSLVSAYEKSSESGEMEPVVYLFGGFNGSVRLNDVWCLRVVASMNCGQAIWQRVHTAGVPPAPRDSATVAFDRSEERLIIFGGYADTLRSDVHILEFSARGSGGEARWVQPQCSPLVSPRQHAAGVIYGGFFVVCLGSNERGAVDEVIQLSLSDFRWTKVLFDVEDLRGRLNCCACALDGGKKLFLFGGTQTTSILEIELDRCDSATPPSKGRK